MFVFPVILGFEQFFDIIFEIFESAGNIREGTSVDSTLFQSLSG